MHFLTFGTSQIVKIIINYPQLVYMTKLCSKVELNFPNYYSPSNFYNIKLNILLLRSDPRSKMSERMCIKKC